MVTMNLDFASPTGSAETQTLDFVTLIFTCFAAHRNRFSAFLKDIVCGTQIAIMVTDNHSAKRVRLSPREPTLEPPTPSLTESGSEISSDSSSEESDSSEEETSEEEDAQDPTALERNSTLNCMTPSDTESTSDADQDEDTPVSNTTPFGSNFPLSERLASFLPQMKAANENLEELRRTGRLQEVTLDEVEEGRPHIEMNLGLGVLEEKNGSGSSSESEEEEDDPETTAQASSESHTQGPKATHVLDKLMGQPKAKRKSVIQEVTDTG